MFIASYVTASGGQVDTHYNYERLVPRKHDLTRTA